MKTLYLLLCCGLAINAKAELPQFDQHASCNNLANGLRHDLANLIMEVCPQHEQKARDRLALIWYQLPKDKQDYCHEIATKDKIGSYVILEGCVLD